MYLRSTAKQVGFWKNLSGGAERGRGEEHCSWTHWHDE